MTTQIVFIKIKKGARNSNEGILNFPITQPYAAGSKNRCRWACDNNPNLRQIREYQISDLQVSAEISVLNSHPIVESGNREHVHANSSTRIMGSPSTPGSPGSSHLVPRAATGSNPLISRALPSRHPPFSHLFLPFGSLRFLTLLLLFVFLVFLALFFYGARCHVWCLDRDFPFFTFARSCSSPCRPFESSLLPSKAGGRAHSALLKSA